MPISLYLFSVYSSVNLNKNIYFLAFQYFKNDIVYVKHLAEILAQITWSRFDKYQYHSHHLVV